MCLPFSQRKTFILKYLNRTTPIHGLWLDFSVCVKLLETTRDHFLGYKAAGESRTKSQTRIGQQEQTHRARARATICKYKMYMIVLFCCCCFFFLPYQYSESCCCLGIWGFSYLLKTCFVHCRNHPWRKEMFHKRKLNHREAHYSTDGTQLWWPILFSVSVKTLQRTFLATELLFKCLGSFRSFR